MKDVPNLSRIATLILLVGAAGVVTSHANRAVATSPPPIAVVNVSSTHISTQSETQHLALDSLDSDMTFTGNASALRIFASSGVDNTAFTFALDTIGNARLAIGNYLLDDSPAPDPFTLVLDDDNEDFTGDVGGPVDVNIRDLAFDATGAITRLDVTFVIRTTSAVNSYYGEVSYGEVQPLNYTVSSRYIVWPQVPVDSQPVAATDWIHNTGSAPLSIGSAVLQGAFASQFRILSDDCPVGTPLLGGSRCSLAVGYAPTSPGTHTAQLIIDAGGAKQTVELTGPTQAGYTGMITSGNEFVDAGKTNDFADGPYQSVTNVGDTNFDLKVGAGQEFGDAYFFLTTVVTDPLTLGVHPIGTSPSAYQLTIAENGRSCQLSGTIDIVRMSFDLNSATAPSVFDARFTAACDDDIGSSLSSSPMTGEVFARVPITPSITTSSGTSALIDQSVSVVGSAPAGATVRIFARPSGTSGFTQAASVLANINGRFAYPTIFHGSEEIYAQVEGVRSPITQVSAAAPSRSAFGAGGSLSPGQALKAGRYRAILQDDGNFVVYGKRTWSARTSGRGGAKLVLQGDGNLVLYNLAGRPLFSTATAGKGGTKLILQTDGNLVLYNARGQALWNSRTE